MADRAAMDEQTYLGFYRETISGYSAKAQRMMCKRLIDEEKITFDPQIGMHLDKKAPVYIEKADPDKVLLKAAMSKELMGFFEKWEYIKLYKYSVPLFYESDVSIQEIISQSGIKQFEENSFTPDYILRTSIQDAVPMWYEEDDKLFIKFVLQKTWVQGENYDQIDYRYPVIIFIDQSKSVLEIRYDAVKFNNQQTDHDMYANMVSSCIKWIIENLNIKLFLCEHSNTIDVVNDKSDSTVRMYKQMMDLKSGAQAELKAAEGSDAVIPFVGELREMINENEELFSKSPEIKELLVKYLNDIEATASYPYIYIKWQKAVESQSYIVKLTFDYLSQKYTLLQHQTGMCNDYGMERMNNAIKYLCESGSFAKGEQIKY